MVPLLTGYNFKIGFYDGVDHVVIDSDQLKEYPELIKWLENETTEKIVYDAKNIRCCA